MADTTNPLYRIKNFEQLIRYLEKELDWPCDRYSFDEITFRYSPDELGIKEEEAVQIKCIYQLRPFFQGQPWGIFFIEFEKKRFPIVLLRRVLNHLIIKKRASANKAENAAWNIDNLLFISAFGDVDTERREIAFAHFHQEQGELPTLRVLGWDPADTVLKMDYVEKTLKEKLRWPQNPKDINKWREQWTGAFLHKPGYVIKTAKELAERLAELARGIRDAAQTLMVHETEKGRLRKLHKAFQTALIHDLSEEDFADTYAQTITYGLLTAAISRTDMTAGKYGTALVAENVSDMVPITNPFLRDMLQAFLKAGGRKGGIDFDELGIQDVVELLRGEETDLPAVLRDFGNRAPGEDPVIHFYEHFLSAYNKKLKVQRGVFYTPRPVVSYIVRSVHELLQKEFGLEDGLASIVTWCEMVKSNPEIKIPKGTLPNSPFVTILDPAVGTATFLVEVIDIIYKTLGVKWDKLKLSESAQQTAWNEYVPKHLLPRLYGYELMMAPYAIAHMKIGLKLGETGYRFGSDERVRIYLTNSLEEPSPLAEQSAASLFEALGHEAKAVNDVKRKVNFIVVIGNPPYAGHSANASKNEDGSWNFIGKILQDYYKVDGRPLGEKNPKWLQDDYVKFLRFAQWRIKESGVGIIAMITNHGYIDNPTFRGMRQQLMQTFNDIYVYDLHGNLKKKETSPNGSKDENVFDIQQGVAICLLIKKIAHKNTKDALRVFHSDLFGIRQKKYEELLLTIIDKMNWKELLPAYPYYLFSPQNLNLREEYNNFISITKAMPLNRLGPNSHRDEFSVSFDEKTLEERVFDMQNLQFSDIYIRNKYNLEDNRDWKLKKARILSKNYSNRKDLIKKCLYRPFDFRYMIYSDFAFDYLRPEVNDHLLKRNIALITTRQTREPFSVLITSLPCAQHKLATPYDGSYIFPLYLYENNSGIQKKLFQASVERENNLSEELIKTIKYDMKFTKDGTGDMWNTFGPEDIFHYMYAVFHSPAYRNRYAEFLKMDFPHLPITINVTLFRKLCGMGKELVELHLFEHQKLKTLLNKFIGNDKTIASGYPKYMDKIVYINENAGFEGVSENVWEFHIGGYQVCEKWLKDRRGRRLLAEDRAHYQKIIVALKETIRLMGEVDKAIEDAGGWPIK